MGERDMFDDRFVEQVQRLVDHEAFTNRVVIQPDGHPGAGAVIGFTMALGEKVVPQTVGSDIGCGVEAASLGIEELPVSYAEADDRIRETVPFGRAVHDFDNAMHIGNDFLWDTVTERFERFNSSYSERSGREIDLEEFTPNGEYDLGYFKALCERVGYNINRAIASAGTLGGGNHFLEVARSEQGGDLWIVLHSGSRGLGSTVANYWQDRAVETRRAERARETLAALLEEGYGPYLKFDPEKTSDDDLLLWLQGGMGESFMRKEKIREELEGEAIDETFARLKAAIPGRGEAVAGDSDEDLAFLEGAEAHGYFVDMLFCQEYAATNRRRMIELACEALSVPEAPVETLDSPHNVIDFEDSVIRKGATRVHENERAVIPFTMQHGSIIIEGKGNEEWNHSSPHGAGRLMSRTQAFEDLSMEEYEDLMNGIYSTSVTAETLDESPSAYKDPGAIEEAMAETATILDRLVPEHSLKAED
ncbi:RNA-splicing ligase RtcB [Halobacteriales archaeon QS_3_64_16]|nr:MAG: RNA-splicing ligase RtcB [Halobacteriales archaeon QS_3_64_16]